MDRIRKIIGGVTIGNIDHAIGKLENGRYIVGAIHESEEVNIATQFETIDSAFDYWYAHLPDGEISSYPSEKNACPPLTDVDTGSEIPPRSTAH